MTNEDLSGSCRRDADRLGPFSVKLTPAAVTATKHHQFTATSVMQTISKTSEDFYVCSGGLSLQSYGKVNKQTGI